MKILVVIDSIDITKGGTSRSSTELIDMLVSINDKFEILLISKNSKDPVVKSFTQGNAKISLHSDVFSAIYSNWSFIRECNVIHIQGLWSFFPSFLGIVVKLLVRPVLIISPRGMLENWSLNQSKLKKSLALLTYQGYLLKNANIIHVTATTEERNILRLYPASRTCIIPNGIFCDNFIAFDTKSAEKVKTILFLSRIHKKKGIELLIESWQNLEYLWNDWRVCIIGDGDSNYIRSLRNRINSMELRSIRIYDPLYGQEKVKAYHSAELFVLPTYSENFGIVVAEALASGLPVITTNGTPWSEISQENIGEIINPSVQELMRAITKWTNLTSEERLAAGKKGQELIRNNYDIRNVAQRFEDLYINALGK